MTPDELDVRLVQLRGHARIVRDAVADAEPSVGLAVALGALAAVVVILESLLPKDGEEVPE